MKCNPDPSIVLRPFNILFATVAIVLPASLAQGAMEFNRDIRPILTQHCTACHGGVKAAGKVSFIYREKALAEGKSGNTTIVPGQPEASEMIRRVLSTDPEEVMPKPEHGPRLSDREVGTLKQWIAEGALWSEHWSLVPPSAPALPVVQKLEWARMPLDRFVLAKLEAEQLTPSAPAPPAEWLRRVSLDLTGLPPSLEDFSNLQKEWLADPEKASAAVVDRLLSAPAFGERWASMWLDLARYADTYGYEKDPHRNIWPWRDWVIRAFNSDMPFDEFTISQLAGDLLPEPTADHLLATAFHRNTQNNTEGGTSDEEFRAAAVVDRVNTTWTAWQGTTFGCVQCHAHPYDPYPHKDYYRFMAFFDNTEDTDLDSDFPRLPVATDPALRDGLAQQWMQAEHQRTALNDQGVEIAKLDLSWEPLLPLQADASGGLLTYGNGERIKASGTLPVGVEYIVTTPAVPGMTALRIQIFPDNDDPKTWPERAAVLSQLSAILVKPDGSRQEVKFKEIIADYLAGPFDPQESLDGGDGGFGSYPVMAGPRWGVAIPETPLPSDAGSRLEIKLKQSAVSNANQQACTLRNFSLSGSRAKAWADLINQPARITSWEKLEALRKAVKTVPSTLVPLQKDRAMAAARDTRVWTRGNRLTPDERVSPGLPDKINPLPSESRLTRLDMARSLVSPQNPLSARVMANRLWAGMFGRGIVESLEDFGSSGAKPSHPELLDHLALRLSTQQGWSVKAFLRELALSATYGQSNRAAPALLLRDPNNIFLSRGPRQRLTAEMVRDHALATAGLLSAKLFGVPVYPPQPEGVWNSVYNGQVWQTSVGADRYRRAIYTYVKRTSGYPAFLSFDAPSRDLCTSRRLTTNTPLQALVTLNDPAYLELAAALARRMEQHGASVPEQIAYGCRSITLDEPPDNLVASLTKLYKEAFTAYQANPDTATKPGGSPEAAAMTLVANTLLNTDLALNR